MNCREQLEAYLRENRVPFNTQHHPLVYTAQEVAASEHISGRLVAKTVFVLADGKLVMAVLPAHHVLDLASLKSALGAKDVRLAEEAEFAAAVPNCEVGAVPPFGNLYGMPVYVDRPLTLDEVIVFRAGSHTETMSVKYEDYARLVQPKVAPLGRLP
mgnify:CR=1 FL=1